MDRRGFFGRLLRGQLGADSERGTTLDDINRTGIEAKQFLTRGSRRKFFNLLGNAIEAGFLAYLLFVEPVPTLLADIATRDEYDENILKKIDCLEKLYDCDFEFGFAVPGYGRFGQLSLNEKYEALRILQEELRKYPPDYVRRCNPEIVIMNCKTLSLKGLASRVHGRHRIVLYIKNRSKKVISSAFHHELEHVSDSTDGREVGAKCDDEMLCGRVKEKEWVALNPQGKTVYNKFWEFFKAVDVVFRIKGEPSGFVRRYGTKSPGEDQATVTESLMTLDEEDDGPNIREQMREDPVLATKVRKLKEYMFRRSNGRMNEQYWKDLEAGRVDEAYWETH